MKAELAVVGGERVLRLTPETDEELEFLGGHYPPDVLHSALVPVLHTSWEDGGETEIDYVLQPDAGPSPAREEWRAKWSAWHRARGHTRDAVRDLPGCDGEEMMPVESD